MTPWQSGLGPVLDGRTRVVVLGSFPGGRSLAMQQYYAHPQNQFWRILGAVIGVADLPALDYAARLAQLLAHGVGLWDVYARARRAGSLDAAIEAAEPNPLATLRARAPELALVAHNGGESAKAMRITRALGVPVVRLPSTSPANASWSLARKVEAWQAALGPVLAGPAAP